jgi:5-formyltetrahydrofolate cyclo-ligase
LDGIQASIEVIAQVALPPLVPEERFLGMYWPLNGEIDLQCLTTHLNGRLALPAVEASKDSDPCMVYRPWHPHRPLRPDACGIPAPDPGPDPGRAPSPPLPAEALALLLAPALAFDRRGIRLGYGGGWFDRRRADPAWRAIPAVAVLPSGCLVEALPRDPWDVPFQGWLDETGLHWLAAD